MLRKKKIPDHPHPENPKLEEDFEQALSVIYGTEEDDPETDFSKLEVTKHNNFTRILLWLLATLIVIGGAAFGGFLLFKNLFVNEELPLVLSIEGPSEITSGTKVSYDLVYENISDVPLAALELKLMIPDGFVLSEIDPARTEEPNIWQLGSITAHSDDRIRISGVWIDAINSSETIQVLASFRPANYNAEFQDIETKVVTISQSVLALTIEGPDSAIVGEKNDYTLTIKNTGQETIENITERLNFPDNFIISGVSTEPTPDTYDWEIGTLEAEAESKLVVSGAFSADTEGNQILKATIGVESEHGFIEQTTSEYSVDVSGSGFALRLLLNGSSENQSAKPGDNLWLSLDTINSSEDIVSNLTTTLSIENYTLIDWSQANLDGGSRSGGTITWNNGTFAPNSTATSNLNLPLVDSSITADQIIFVLTANLTGIGSDDNERTVESSPLTISLQSDLGFDNQGYYYQDGVAVGSGPLPPQVGQTTTYRLVWTLSNSLHSLENTTVSAILPSTATFVQSITADMGTITYNESTRTVSWQIGHLPTSINRLQATFDVSITPSASDVGKFVKLCGAPEASAKDGKTSERLSVSGSEQTTDLPDDSDAQGQGVVIVE